MRYNIYEGNLERLEKKLARIAKKCEKYGCAFTYEKVGEEMKTITTEEGEKVTSKFIVVEVEGTAVVNNWKFIGSVEHTEAGNIIEKVVSDIEVPERYYTTAPICEHCNSKRTRKNTYIVMNTETGEFKQVGKSCLKDFTCGLSAEMAAQYIELLETMTEFEAPMPGCHITHYLETRTVLQYCAETIRHLGYVKADLEKRGDSTKDKVRDFLFVDTMVYGKLEAKAEMLKIGFDADSAEAIELTDKALEWLATQEESNNYMHNLKTACAIDYVTIDKIGLLASLFPTYNRELEYQKAKAEEAKVNASSQFVGEVGQKVEFKIASAKVVAGWSTQFGYTSIYKIVDEEGNIYTWKTTGGIPEEVTVIKGTVKAHNEYRGIKQTELTRCRCK